MFKTFFEFQFKYCLLTWIFCSRTTNNRIKQLRERTLRQVCNSYGLPLCELLEKGGSFTVHYYNTQTLAIETINVYKNLSGTIFSDLFIRRENNFCRNREFQIPRLYSVWNGSNLFRCFEPIIWDFFPSEHKYTFIGKFQDWNL